MKFGPHLYKLVDRKAVPCDDPLEWAHAFQAGGVGYSVGDTDIGDARVSTVFLGIDTGMGQGGPPRVFETMVFGGKFDGSIQRCATWEQAETMHAMACARVRQNQDEDTP